MFGPFVGGGITSVFGPFVGGITSVVGGIGCRFVGAGSLPSSVNNRILPTILERGNDCDVILDCPVVIAPAVPLIVVSPTTNG